MCLEPPVPAHADWLVLPSGGEKDKHTLCWSLQECAWSHQCQHRLTGSCCHLEVKKTNTHSAGVCRKSLCLEPPVPAQADWLVLTSGGEKDKHTLCWSLQECAWSHQCQHRLTDECCHLEVKKVNTLFCSLQEITVLGASRPPVPAQAGCE